MIPGSGRKDAGGRGHSKKQDASRWGETGALLGFLCHSARARVPLGALVRVVGPEGSARLGYLEP